MSKPCRDCVDIHGDDPQSWLRKWPEGAEWWDHHKEYLCDGCTEERGINEDCEIEYFDPKNCQFHPRCEDAPCCGHNDDICGYAPGYVSEEEYP